MKKILFTALFFLSTNSALAAGGGGSGFGVAINPFYFTSTSDTGTAVTTTYTYVDPEIGYAMSSGLYIGGLYQYETLASGSTTWTYSAFGPSVGYSSNGWRIVGSYLLSGTVDLGNGTKYQKGSGFRVALGHDWMMGSNFFAGMQFVYQSMSYTELASGSTTLTTTYKLSSVTPAFRLGVMF